MNATVFMFPGQSSRYPEMIAKCVAADAACAAVVDEASAVLGRDLAAHYRADNPAVLATNRDVQVGVFLANHLHLTALEAAGVRADWSLGLSLGEYNHLVHIGALALEDALRLVDARGRLYDQAQGGLMVSVFPVEAALVETTIHRLGFEGRACVGLYNSPRQQVISGERGAVEAVVTALEADVFCDATVIEPRIPMHAPVFAGTATQLANVLIDVPFTTPRRPYVPNVRGEPIAGATSSTIRICLTEHVFRAVRWQASVEAVAARVPGARFVEVGPKAVLYNLFGRGWTPGARFKTDVAEGDDDWPAHLSRLTEELDRAS